MLHMYDGIGTVGTMYVGGNALVGRPCAHQFADVRLYSYTARCNRNSNIAKSTVDQVDQVDVPESRISNLGGPAGEPILPCIRLQHQRQLVAVDMNAACAVTGETALLHAC